MQRRALFVDLVMLTGRLVFSREALAPRQCSSTPEKVTGVKEADVSSANQEAVTKYDSNPVKVEDLIKIKAVQAVSLSCRIPIPTAILVRPNHKFSPIYN